jgi:predicted nucleotidyltransferase
MKTLDDLALRRNEKEAIREATRILKERFPVKEVILFGSKVRGDDDEESDIDLMLITTRPIEWRERKEVIHDLFAIELANDVVISILDVTVSDWETGIFTVFPIREEIVREGVTVP